MGPHFGGTPHIGVPDWDRYLGPIPLYAPMFIAFTVHGEAHYGVSQGLALRARGWPAPGQGLALLGWDLSREGIHMGWPMGHPIQRARA